MSDTPQRSDPANPWLSFAALCLLFFLVSAGAFSSLGVVLPAMVAELKWNWTEAGMGYSLLGVACGLASFLPAILIRRIGVSGTMGVGTLMLVAGFGLLATAHAIWQYLGGTLLIGTAFAAIVSPLVAGIVIDATGNWYLPFLMSLALLAVGGVSAFWMRPERAFPDV